MKLHGHRFDAELRYTFHRHGIEGCQNCRQELEQHADGKCYFEATTYAPSELLDFFEKLLREGGVLTLKAGEFSLVQKIKAVEVSRDAAQVLGDIQTEGDAYLQGPIDDA